MAKLDISGFEEVERLFLQQAEVATKAVPLMLRAGADVYIKGQKEVSDAMDIRRTGDFINSIGIYKEDISDNAATIEILPTGTDRRGVRNAEKGFLAHYGIKKQAGKSRRKGKAVAVNLKGKTARPWMDEANEKYGEQAYQAMARVWEELSNG